MQDGVILNYKGGQWSTKNIVAQSPLSIHGGYMDPLDLKSVPNPVSCGKCSKAIHFGPLDLVEVSPRRGSSPDLVRYPYCADYKHVCGCGTSNWGIVWISREVAEQLRVDKERREQQTTLQVVASEG